MADPANPKTIDADPTLLAAAAIPQNSGSVMVGETLPDTSMIWRRWISTVLALVGDWIVYAVSTKIHDADSLKWIVLALIGYNAMLALFYFAGASATDIFRIIGAVRTKRDIMENVTKQAAQQTDKPA